ncbi:unnamed protein product [Rotaria socialis]|uniref:Checkpoint protein RAD24-like helical bundle domain-containing protein n=1 Tax=Rotaria socialis TaxID=392032 RepID=A0A817QRE3_9BILA|nr:unnamed protein product [Rotaria socialis]
MKLLLDLPNGFYSDVSSFHSILRELKRTAYHPIVFVITDNSSLSASNNPNILFSLSIIDELKIEQISFNPIAPTFMKKALELIIHQASLLKLKPPPRDCITDIIQTANGDLRLAINTLQFSSNNKLKVSIGKLNSKDTCLSLFQGLGRILYKKDSEEDSTDENKNQPENFIEQCHISAPTFIGFLFENYIDFYSSIDDAATLCDHFSITEHILNEWESRSQLLSVSSSIACRAVRLCNSVPMSRGFKPLRKPQESDVRTRVQKNQTLLSTNKLYYGCSREEYFCTVLPYQAFLLKISRSETTNATNRSILDIGFINRHAKKCNDINSMVTGKNSSIALLTDNTQTDETSYNFSLTHATTIKLNELEYDDNVDIDIIDD